MTGEPEPPRPLLNQVDLIVNDIDASADFYRLLGLALPEAHPWPPGSSAVHLEGEMPNGSSFSLNNLEMARLWHAGVGEGGSKGNASRSGGRTVIGFHLPSPDAVDETYARVLAAGYAGPQEPYDAFWGARYAVVVDPDGNHVGLMGPLDRARAYVPKVQ